MRAFFLNGKDAYNRRKGGHSSYIKGQIRIRLPPLKLVRMRLERTSTFVLLQFSNVSTQGTTASITLVLMSFSRISLASLAIYQPFLTTFDGSHHWAIFL
jgi:hypothetical protein